MSVYHKEALKSFKRILTDRWNNCWKGSCTVYNIHRKYQVTLFRLRIAYANFTYLLKEEDLPIHSRCGVIHSMEQAIACCPKYQWQSEGKSQET